MELKDKSMFPRQRPRRQIFLEEATAGAKADIMVTPQPFLAFVVSHTVSHCQERWAIDQAENNPWGTLPTHSGAPPQPLLDTSRDSEWG